MDSMNSGKVRGTPSSNSSLGPGKRGLELPLLKTASATDLVSLLVPERLSVLTCREDIDPQPSQSRESLWPLQEPADFAEAPNRSWISASKSWLRAQKGAM